MIPYLNWQEISRWVDIARPELVGLFVDRIVVPQRPYFPDGYLKGEILLRLTSRKREGILVISTGVRRPYIIWNNGKGPAAAAEATRSPL